MSDSIYANPAIKSTAPAPLTEPTEEALRHVTDVIDDSYFKAQTYVTRYPLHSVGFGFAAGLALGLLWGGCKACERRSRWR